MMILKFLSANRVKEDVNFYYSWRMYKGRERLRSVNSAKLFGPHKKFKKTGVLDLEY